jgi:hypothetical protein
VAGTASQPGAGLSEFAADRLNTAMNYLAHGYRFLDSPLKLAGTAVPDWLSVVDRKVRIRRRRVNEHLGALKDDDLCLADGMLQHLDDDDRFHRCTRFMIMESELSVRFRRIMPDPYDHRPPFLGHIVTELLLDSIIAEQMPEILSGYYSAMAEVSPNHVQQLVNRLATRTTDQLAGFIHKFRSAQFLYDYADDSRLLGRLNQVLRRVTLPLLDEQSLSVLRDSRVLVRIHADELLQAVENPACAEQG